MSGSLHDAIVAPATPVGRSALALVRLDGPGSLAILGRLTDQQLVPRRATHLRLTHGGEVLDDAVVVCYQAPHSFTGNDLVEFSLHGSPFLVERLIRICLAEGARAAEAGEFTERAVLNGKLDLVQAEAVFNLIASRTAMQARLSLGQLDGALSTGANAVRADLLHVISRYEAALDFAEEGYEFIDRGEALSRIDSSVVTVDELLATYDRGRAITAGITAVILGRPNAGKSTLMNYLCGSERAIVTEIAGTTRDLLRESISLGGMAVTIVDTAGLRETEDVVEGIGVRRAREAGRQAELVIYLIDGERGNLVEDEEFLSEHPEALVVYTKADRAAGTGELAISVPARIGLESFLEKLDAAVRARYSIPEQSAVVVNERQRQALEETKEALVSVAQNVRNGVTEEVVLVDLYRAANALGRLVGAITHGNVMGEIFSKFCIGK